MDLQLDHKYDREYARGLVVFRVRFEGGKTGGFERPFFSLHAALRPRPPPLLRITVSTPAFPDHAHTTMIEGVIGKLGVPWIWKGVGEGNSTLIWSWSKRRSEGLVEEGGR